MYVIYTLFTDILYLYYELCILYICIMMAIYVLNDVYNLHIYKTIAMNRVLNPRY